jgi:hypothetical protein
MNPMFTPKQYNLLWRILSESAHESPEKEEIMQAIVDVLCHAPAYAALEARLNELSRPDTAASPQAEAMLCADIDLWAKSLPDSISHEGVRLQTLALFLLD